MGQSQEPGVPAVSRATNGSPSSNASVTGRTVASGCSLSHGPAAAAEAKKCTDCNTTRGPSRSGPGWTIGTTAPAAFTERTPPGSTATRTGWPVAWHGEVPVRQAPAAACALARSCRIVLTGTPFW